MIESRKGVLALFYCQRTPRSSEPERRQVERKWEGRVRLFPMPCSGRLDGLHMLRALEEFADMAALVTCPEGTCRYFEGNRRARKRVEKVREILSAVGLESERAVILVRNPGDFRSLDELTQEMIRQMDALGPSPLFREDLGLGNRGSKRSQRV